jgi:predicted ferric reductase
MIRFLGWLNISLLVIMVLPFLLRQFHMRVRRFRGKWYPKLMKVLRKVHKPLGIAIVLLALLHGLLVFGGFRLHTGTLEWFAIVLVAAFGATFYFTKKKAFLVWHRYLIVLLLAMVLLHQIFPGALYYLFG